MTPGKFQEVTEALMAWIFPGGWKFPGGPGNFQGVTETSVSWFFPGGLEYSRGPWKNPGESIISLWERGEYCHSQLPILANIF